MVETGNGNLLTLMDMFEGAIEQIEEPLAAMYRNMASQAVVIKPPPTPNKQTIRTQKRRAARAFRERRLAIRERSRNT